MTCETGLGEWIDFRRLKWQKGKGNRVTSDAVSSACKMGTTLRAGLSDSLSFEYMKARHGVHHPETDHKCPSLHSLQEKKDWKFYELMGQGGQGWIQVIQAVLALARVAWVHWVFIFPPVKWGGGFSATSQPTVCSAAPDPGRCVPSWWQPASPWLPAGLSLLMLVPMPETPLLLKPSSCGQIQVRQGRGRAWEAGVGMS